MNVEVVPLPYLIKIVVSLIHFTHTDKAEILLGAPRVCERA